MTTIIRIIGVKQVINEGVSDIPFDPDVLEEPPVD
jgi:hypothetical protein